MANEGKKLIAKYKGELNRNRNDLKTAESARQIALTQSTAPNLTDAERAKQRKRYKDFDNKVKQLEEERISLQTKLNDAQRAEGKPQGLADVESIKNKYNSLMQTYNSIQDKTSSDAVSLKQRMNALIDDFQKAYSKSVGTPVSKAVATANLKGTSLDTGDITLNASKTAKEVVATEDAAKAAGATGDNKTGDSKYKPIVKTPLPAKSTTGTFTEPMTIAGQVSNVGGPSGAKQPSRFEDLIGRTEFWYNLPDYIFKVNPALQGILVKAVDEGWDDAKFLAAAQQTPWWQQNSASIRTRIVDKAKYDELRSQGLDVSKTDYALDSASIKRRIKGIAQQKGANLSEDQLDAIVAQAYNGFLENDSVALTQLIAPYIGTIPAILKGAQGISSTYSGEALKNYQTLQDVARQNGFKLQDILPNMGISTNDKNLESTILSKIATGDLDVNAIAQNARLLAAAGQPQYVRDLLGQGYDLSAIYAPYRTAMAGILELNPDQIDLNDPTLRMGITDKGDMNLYDYRKMLKQDNRWQYTANASQEVSDAALRVLRDFGMMG